MGVVRVMPQFSLGICILYGLAHIKVNLRRHLLDSPHAIIMRLHQLRVSFTVIPIPERDWTNEQQPLPHHH